MIGETILCPRQDSESVLNCLLNSYAHEADIAELVYPQSFAYVTLHQWVGVIVSLRVG